MSRTQLFIFIVVIVALTAIPAACAFGAGNVPSFSYMEGKAFRHGDLEDVLTQLIKKSGGLLGRGSKFGGLDVKRIYFGNWLRDYSQAMDIAALEKMSKQTVLNLVMVLGFMAHGYATGEFEVTSERLGVYLPTEHIDNPKGYGEGKDPRKFDPRLRGPIDNRELEVDPRSGMKNYIANETGSWDTSSALVRRTLLKCIETGRQARRSGDEKQLHEAFRLLGQCLHTMEDFTAHSNWCELALFRLGHPQVFLHVGDNVKVRAPDGTSCAPLVTGTFGGSDFMHSLLGEAQDHLSEASVSDLNKAVNDARSRGSNPMSDLFGLLGSVPGGSSSGMSRDAEELSRGPSSDPMTMSPQEVYKNLFRILSFRDSVMMTIEKTIEKIPGLNSLVEKASNALSVFVFTLIEPYVQPLMKQAMGGLHAGSSEVINNEDQYEVFNNANASDPTHSILSKDHFGLVLNEVAGKVAIIIVRHCVNLVVKAWDDERVDAQQVADECLAPIFHPNWFDRNRCHKVQEEMMGFVSEWASANRSGIAKLDREHVRSHRNTRSGKAEAHSHGNSNSNYGVQVEGQQGLAMGTSMAHNVQSYVGGKIQGAMGGHQLGQGMFREAPQENGRGTSGGYQSGEQQGEGQQQYGHQGYPSAGHSQGSMGMPDEQSYVGEGGGYQQNQYGAPSSFNQGHHGYPQREQDEYGRPQQDQYGSAHGGPPPGMPMANPDFTSYQQPSPGPPGYGPPPGNYGNYGQGGGYQGQQGGQGGYQSQQGGGYGGGY